MLNFFLINLTVPPAPQQQVIWSIAADGAGLGLGLWKPKRRALLGHRLAQAPGPRSPVLGGAPEAHISQRRWLPWAGQRHLPSAPYRTVVIPVRQRVRPRRGAGVLGLRRCGGPPPPLGGYNLSAKCKSGLWVAGVRCAVCTGFPSGGCGRASPKPEDILLKP